MVSIVTSPGFALRSERFATLLAFLLPLPPNLRCLSRIFCQEIAIGGQSRLDSDHTLTTNNLDRDALPLGPLDDLRCPAHVVALLRARNLRRFSLA